MINENKSPERIEGKNKIFNNTIITPNSNDNFTINDWKNSGISEEIINDYISKGYLKSNANEWQLSYPELFEDKKSEYWTKRLKYPKDAKNKYIRPEGQTSKLFRPHSLPLESLLNPEEYIVLTEGEKKAIKACQEGINCVAIPGVWTWKRSVHKQFENLSREELIKLFESVNFDDEIENDIIPDVLNMQWENKTVYICFDNDMWEKEQVKDALYSLSCYLIGIHKAKVKIIMLPKGKEKGLDDYLLAHGSESFKKLMDNAKELTLTEAQNILMGNQKTDIKFPVEIFPDEFRENILDLAENMDAPVEYIACSIIAGASMLMDGYYSIKVLENSGWIDYPILWMCIIGTASQKKTPCLLIPKKIITEFEVNLAKQYEYELKQYKEATAQQANKKKKPSEAENNIEILKEPVRQKITCQDATVEALARAINNNKKRGIAIFVDELASFLKGMGQYKKNGGNDEEYYLQSWKKQSYQYDRAGGANYLIFPSHNILGTIQPKVLDKTLFKGGVETTNGMIERWLFVCSEYEETGKLYTGDKPYSVELIKNMYNRIYKNTIEKCFNFSPEAQVIYNKFWEETTQSKKDVSKTDLMKSYVQKQTDYVARLSLILHVMFEPNLDEISIKSVQRAIALSKYFIDCFAKTARVSMNSQSNELATSTLEYLKTNKKREITPSKLYKSNSSKYKNTNIAKIALEILSGQGFGRLEKTLNKGYKFKLYT